MKDSPRKGLRLDDSMPSEALQKPRTFDKENLIQLRERLRSTIEELAKANVSKMLTELDELEEKALNLAISSDAQVSVATDLALKLKALQDEEEELRERFGRPSLELTKAINGVLKPIGDRASDLVTNLRKKVDGFKAEQFRKRQEEEERERQRVEKERREALAKAEAEKKKAEAKGKPAKEVFVPPAYVPPPAPSMNVQGKSGTAQMSMVWDFEVTNQTAIPLDYWLLDEKKIRKVIDAGVREIPGVRIFQRPRTSFK